MAEPKFFAQLRSLRRVDGTYSEVVYVCAFWRTRDARGRSKQAGTSISTSKRGIEAAAAMALDRARRHCAVDKTVDDILRTLSW